MKRERKGDDVVALFAEEGRETNQDEKQNNKVKT